MFIRKLWTIIRWKYVNVLDTTNPHLVIDHGVLRSEFVPRSIIKKRNKGNVCFINLLATFHVSKISEQLKRSKKISQRIKRTFEQPKSTNFMDFTNERAA